MSFPWGAIIGAGAGLIGQGINASNQASMNKEQQGFAREMYMRQRQDALADRDFENSYNHPSEQMKRFRDAGLNPNLVYGTGTQTQSAGMPAPPTPQWNPRAPQFDLGSVMGTYFDTQVREAQIDNLREQNKSIQADTALKMAQAISTSTGTVKQELENKLAGELYSYQLSAGMEKSRQESITTSNMVAEQEVRQMRIDLSLAENAERVLALRIGNERAKQEIANLEKDGKLKELDINLKRMGINPSDPTYIRVIGQILAKYTNIMK